MISMAMSHKSGILVLEGHSGRSSAKESPKANKWNPTCTDKLNISSFLIKIPNILTDNVSHPRCLRGEEQEHPTHPSNMMTRIKSG